MEIKDRRGASVAGMAERNTVYNGGSVNTLKLISYTSAAVIGFLFGGCHIAFGAYPLGLGLVCALPCCVWSALIGVVIGSIVSGSSGIIYGMVAVLAVFLRVIISGGGIKKSIYPEAPSGFDESVSLRLSSAVVGGFVSAIYELLLEGMSAESLLFASVMLIVPAAVTLLLSGAFMHGVGLKDLLFGKGRIFTNGAPGILIYKISLLSFVFLASVSLKRYDIFGIDPSFIFSGALTLFAAKRFGPLYGAVCGFVSSAPISGLYSVSFALAGAASGAIFCFGWVYAIIAAGALLSVWGAYVGGVSGFLEVFPEYVISASLILPAIRYLERENANEGGESATRLATDMVGTMALSHRSSLELSCASLSDGLCRLSGVMAKYRGTELLSEDYSLFARISEEANRAMLEEREMDGELSDRLEALLDTFGLTGGVIRAFGKRRVQVVCAAEDKDGTFMTSPKLKAAIEGVVGLKMSAKNYYRRNDMVLMECLADKKYKIEGACSKIVGARDEISGDSAIMFESKDMFAYGLICDGMGSGNEAKRTADFSSEFIRNALDLGVNYSTLIYMLNSAMRRSGDECGIAVDLFSFDLITGEACFLKSGAAASYIKRSGSLFRIRSETMPLGILREVDSERIGAKVEPGDLIIMLSDGMLNENGENERLIKLLNKPALSDLSEYASLIAEDGAAGISSEDDKSVIVLRISEL